MAGRLCRCTRACDAPARAPTFQSLSSSSAGTAIFPLLTATRAHTRTWLMSMPSTLDIFFMRFILCLSDMVMATLASGVQTPRDSMQALLTAPFTGCADGRGLRNSIFETLRQGGGVRVHSTTNRAYFSKEVGRGT